MKRIKVNLQTKILLSFFAIMIISAGLILVIMQLNQQYLRDQQAQLLENQAKYTAQQISSFISQTKRSYLSAATNLAQQWPVQDEHFTSVADLTFNNSLDTQTLSLISPQGKYLHSTTRTSPNPLSVEPASAYFEAALLGSTVMTQSYLVDNDYHTTIYTPVQQQDQVIGVLKAQLSLAVLNNLQQSSLENHYANLFIINNQGQLVYQPSSYDIDPQVLRSQDFVQRSLQDQHAIEIHAISQNNIPVVSASSYLSDTGWIVVIEKSQQAAFGEIALTNNIILICMVVAMIILLIVALILSNRIAKPVARLTYWARQIQAGRLPKSNPINTGDELEDLSNTLQTMAQQLAFRQQTLEQANTNLSLEKDRHSTLLQSLTSGVFATDKDNNIILFNKAAESITQLKAKAVLNRPVDAALQFYRKDDLISLDEYSNQSTRYKNRLRQEGLQFKTDDSERLLSLSVAPVNDDNNQQAGWVVSFHDMTQEKELEAMKLDFVSMAAHELRTPLTALRGYLSILEYESMNKLNKDEQTYLERSVVSSSQLSSLVENLLNLSRIERGSFKLDLTPLQPEDMLRSALSNLQEVAKQRGVAIEFEEPSKPLPLMMADNFRIAEVVTNLAANSINYSKPENGWVKISARAKGNTIEISVADNGQGIPASSLPRMFTKFYRVQSSLAMGSKGTGLGLFISKAIVDAHKGKIWVESEVGKGSTFTFSVPQAPKGSKVLIFGKPLK